MSKNLQADDLNPNGKDSKHIMCTFCPFLVSSSVSVYEAGDPGLCPARSACHRKVEFYHCVIDSFPPVPTTGSTKTMPCIVMSM